MRLILNILIIIAIAMTGFFANDLLALLNVNEPSNPTEEYCYLSAQPCQQHGVELRLAQDSTHAMQANHLTVTWPEQKSETLILTLRGLEMDMGIVKIPLSRADDNTYQADIVLPVCTQSQMTWVGEITDGTLSVFPAIRSSQ